MVPWTDRAITDVPATQLEKAALHDKELATLSGQETDRQLKRLRGQIKNTSPQALTIPTD